MSIVCMQKAKQYEANNTYYVAWYLSNKYEAQKCVQCEKTNWRI